MSSAGGEGPRIERELRDKYIIPTAADLKSKLAEVYLIDVREPHEVASGRVEEACKYVNIPIGQIFASLSLSDQDFATRFGVEKPNDDDDVVAMCLAGIRSTWALQVLHKFGYRNSKHFPGGWLDWSNNFPQKQTQ